jgi:hypothetical protein
MFTSHIRAGTLVATLGLVAGVTAACGGSSSSTSTGAQATLAQSAGPSSAITSADRSKVDKCLKAAGISVPTGRPGGGSGGAPQPASSSSTNRPAAGGGGGLFQTPQTQQALKACGITLSSSSSHSG